jgi:hypothetical protein
MYANFWQKVRPRRTSLSWRNGVTLVPKAEVDVDYVRPGWEQREKLSRGGLRLELTPNPADRELNAGGPLVGCLRADP